MTRKRRTFDIELPEEPVEASTPSSASLRRGPMATAVSETAVSLRQRHDLEQSIRAENDALAHEFVRLKKLGLIVDRIPLDAIGVDQIPRDRASGPDPELGELIASIRDVGLSNPIRVEAISEGQYELIQGYRRLMAYRALNEAHPSSGYEAIPAGVSAPGASLEENYRRMVDENAIRKDVSFAEMAMLAQAFVADPHTSSEAVEDAVGKLFKSSGYQKRTYIRSFARLLDLLDGALADPRTLSRNLGLAVLKKLEADNSLAERLKKALQTTGDPKEQNAILQKFADEKTPKPAKRADKPETSRRAKTTFRYAASGEEIKCIASVSRLELSEGPDFSAYRREDLERAIQAFFTALKQQ